MNTLLTIWRASWRSGTNAFLYDGRIRVGKLLALICQIVLGIWGCARLHAALLDWQSSHTLDAHLWLTCVAAWGVIALFAVLGTFSAGLNSREALLLATQPLAPARRLRALYGMIAFKEGGNWLLWEVNVFGIALAAVLGWSVLVWLAVLIMGAVLITWIALIMTLLIVYVSMAYTRVVVGNLGGLLALGGLCVLVLGETGRLSFILIKLPALFALSFPTPELVLVGLLLCWLIALGPLALLAGKLYLSTLLTWHNRAQKSQAFTFPGIRSLVSQCQRSRTLSAALLTKGLLNQSRHPLAWVRGMLLLILLALFGVMRAAASPLHLPPLLFLAAYATLLAVLMLFEYAPYAISSEGNRLALYVTLPRGLDAFLRARLLSFLCPTLGIGFTALLILDLWVRLSLPDLGVALLLVGLLLCGYTTFTVLGSALDEDLALSIEDTTQALMQEEMPLTPRRLQLLSMTVLLLTGYFALLWRLPLFYALFSLTIINILLAGLMWWLSTSHVARLLRD